MAIIRRNGSPIGNRINRYARQKISARYLPYILLLIASVYGFIFTQPTTTAPTNQLSTSQGRNGESSSHTTSKQPFHFRATNLEILQKSTPMDITYQYAAGDKSQDPHRGAQDAQFQWGYKPNVRALRTNPPEFNLTGEALRNACQLRDSDYKMIHDKVSIDPKANQEKSAPKIFASTNLGTQMRWFCGCLQHHRSISGNCAHLFGGAKEIYLRKWLRVRATWSFVYDNYYQDYDWFYLCNDMVFLLVENLRLYLESDEIQAAANFGHNETTAAMQQQNPIFLGRRFALGGDRNEVFNAGGPGYALNKAALKTFVLGAPDHPPQQHTSQEDLMIARTFRSLGVHPYDTQDDMGGERFMITTPGHHYDSQFPPWYHKQSMNLQHGKDHCAERSISFHYVPVELMYRLYALLYGKCSPSR